jgi:hypothetical protein
MLENALHWYKGEVFEAKFILLFGVITIALSLVFRYGGTTPYARALFIPMLVVGLLFAISAGWGIYSNEKKAAAVEQRSQADTDEFIVSEKKRVEDFQWLYTFSLITSAVSFAVALIFLVFTKNIYLHATAIALVWFGIAFMVIDYFSKERATIYYEQLTTARLQKP